MLTSERAEQFKEEFIALMKKYKIDITVEENFCRGYTEIEGINFYSYAVYDEHCNMIEPCIDLTFKPFELNWS